MSDGKFHLNTLMPVKNVAQSLIAPELVKRNSIITVEEYALKEVIDKKDPSKSTRLVLATKVSVVETEVPQRIGNPVDITKDDFARRQRQKAKSNPALKPASSAAVVKRVQRSANDYDPIQSINPYRNSWTIKARVTKRGQKKTWSNSRGEGSLFSVDLLDADGTEIRATFWKEAVDMFYDMLAPGAVATFSGGRVRAANKQWTSIKNEYELSFDRSARITPIQEDDASIKKIHFDFEKLNSIEAKEANATLDICAVVKQYQPISSIISRKSGAC